MKTESPLQKLRCAFQPNLPLILQEISHLQAEPSLEKRESKTNPEIAELFPKSQGKPFITFAAHNASQNHSPLKAGVVLSGGQAAGGHNVITGLYDALKKLNKQSRLYGFLGGPSGIIANKCIELTAEKIDPYRNMGGFDMIGAGRTKIETPEDFQASAKTVATLGLDGLVIVGGDDSNTNAAWLAEYFLKNNIPTCVVGVPKTIDGDLKNGLLEISFGFDTASKTFSEYIGNVLRDALSAAKYYFFIKVMGRSASHIALECALQTHPNMTLIGEEVAEKKMTVSQITHQLCDMICRRSEQGKDFGVIIFPEGLIEFISECKILIVELNRLVASGSIDIAQLERLPSSKDRASYIMPLLSKESAACFASLPSDIQGQLLLDRDPHGNVQVSKIETERLFIETVKKELKDRQNKETYKGKFSAQPLFCGYEGRSCFPSNFDAQYAYALGNVAALLIDNRETGYMSCIRGLAQPIENWQIGGIPLIEMMDLETRKGAKKPVIRKALVDLNGGPFLAFQAMCEKWKLDDDYRYPGPLQFFGPSELVDAITFTLAIEQEHVALKE